MGSIGNITYNIVSITIIYVTANEYIHIKELAGLNLPLNHMVWLEDVSDSIYTRVDASDCYLYA